MYNGLLLLEPSLWNQAVKKSCVFVDVCHSLLTPASPPGEDPGHLPREEEEEGECGQDHFLELRLWPGMWGFILSFSITAIYSSKKSLWFQPVKFYFHGIFKPLKTLYRAYSSQESWTLNPKTRSSSLALSIWSFFLSFLGNRIMEAKFNKPWLPKAS